MPTRGALSPQELFAVLRSTTDAAYLQPFLDAGYGSGLELFEALTDVLSRVSEAVDRTTQALYILPWSGQTNPPAEGARPTRVRLRLERTRRVEIPFTILAGAVLYEEVARDWGPDGAVSVRTGRRYTLTEDYTFLPGQAGPVLLDAVSYRDGYGYGNPEIGSISAIVQVGADFENDLASVSQGPTTALLTMAQDPDVLTPEHVGQYVEFVGGSNTGAVRLVYGYEGPIPLVNGGTATLAPIFVARATATPPTGSFVLGETVTQYDISVAPPVVIAEGRLRAATAVGDGPPWYLVIEHSSGAFEVTDGITYGPVTGNTSGGTFPLEDFDGAASFAGTRLADEAATATWRVLDWSGDVGLSVTNPEAAEPGDVAMLDAIGAERKINRAPGEDDESYRKRVAQIADTVSPNAIRRIGNRIWSFYGGAVCLREVGFESFPGIYADVDAFDYDGVTMLGLKTGQFADGERVGQDNGGVWTYGRVTSTIVQPVTPFPTPPLPPPAPSGTTLEVAAIDGPGFVTGAPIVGESSGASFVPAVVLGGLRPTDQWRVLLDYADMRAFFLVGVPSSDAGEFGAAFDAGPHNAFDAAPYLAFWDGYARDAALLNRQTYQAIDEAKACGVGFDLYVETGACV